MKQMIKTHDRCGTEISFKNVSKNYYAQCPNCDEDLYEFEIGDN
jgi:uncharacterized paraquat-inducible protein A